ncbi:MAG TPA: hypothetical protein VM871_11180, partial [Flavisolibacter sp.]|nr:hypothetical protein [Flavisolibacter sp.]
MHYSVTEILPDALSLTTEVLFETGRSLPGSVQYIVKRYAKPAAWMGDEKGQLRYHYEPSNPAKNQLELRFCLVGNVYCKKFRNECNLCKAHQSEDCEARMESIDFVSVSFSGTMLGSFVQRQTAGNTLAEKVLSFSHPASFTRTVTLCGKTRILLEGLLNHGYTDNLEAIF